MTTNDKFAPEGTRLFVTGGAGFIGSNFVRLAIENGFNVTVFDALTYAGNMENLAGVEERFRFVRGDIRDAEAVRNALRESEPRAVIHFAAESHVDRSILGPKIFTETNVLGTHVLIEECRQAGIEKFIHISTDEVYGSLGSTGLFTEESPLDPTSPYAASKAASDLVVQSYAKTYGFPAVILRCSNNYGPFQFPEKLIPLMIIKASNDEKLPVYGDGQNIRDWIYVMDYGTAILRALERGTPGEVYNVGSSNEWKNIDIVRLILEEMDKPLSLITYVKDRPAHDRRYAIDSSKIRRDLGWEPETTFEKGIRQTIDWYMTHRQWWNNIMTGEYLEYYEKNYKPKL
ncbi:MAG: dTDP-glucose 4,6-dehydratase [Chlorobi bacterium]|nr:dTDP-glucose 4,6-dehydratase [Chlorobiota bacterium]